MKLKQLSNLFLVLAAALLLGGSITYGILDANSRPVPPAVLFLVLGLIFALVSLVLICINKDSK